MKTTIQSHIGVADKLEEQIMTLQAKAINELDESVVRKKSKYMKNNFDEEETENIQTQVVVEEIKLLYTFIIHVITFITVLDKT